VATAVLHLERSRFDHSSLGAQVQTGRSESRCASSNFKPTDGSQKDFTGILCRRVA